MLRQGYAPGVALVEEPDRAPSVPVTDQVSVEKPHSRSRRSPLIARRPDTIVGFGETRIHTETATFEVRASEVPDPTFGRPAHR
jgi:hypothetical protein